VTMHHHVNHHYSSSLLQTTKYVEDLFPKTENQIAVSVKQTTLDTWRGNARNINPDILIKIDVQGYEDRVIRGGCSLFKKAKACILEINLADLYHGQASFRDIFLLLDELGYGYSGNLAQEYNNDGQVVYIDALFLKGN
jgi:Methyltransferase FkbM domain